MRSLQKTYDIVGSNVPQNTMIDSLEVVKQVEDYRQFWKPDETNVVLLAESHVYTDKEDFRIELDRSLLHEFLPDYPSRFVRFVYCLGYGEEELLTRIRLDRRNAGTPQYWKIFSACIADSEDDLGFDKVLKTETQNFIDRISNKVDVLRKMKTKGVYGCWMQA